MSDEQYERERQNHLSEGEKVDLLEYQLIGDEDSVGDELRRKYINKFFNSGAFQNITQMRGEYHRNIYYHRSLLLSTIIGREKIDVHLSTGSVKVFKDFIYWYKTQLIEELRDRKINDLGI